jgi:hypothetical protein
MAKMDGLNGNRAAKQQELCVREPKARMENSLIEIGDMWLQMCYNIHTL